MSSWVHFRDKIKVGELTEIGHKSGVNDGLHVPSIGGCIVVDHDNTEALASQN